MQHTTKQVVVNGLLTNYIVAGKGKTVVLLHGWGDSAHGMQPMIESLSKDYELIVPDLPGFGKSQPPQDVWGLDEYAGHVADLLQKIDKKPYAFVGHSNGGAIAVRGIANGLLEAERLVLLASAGIRGEYKGRIKAIRLVTKAGKFVTSPLPKSAKNKLRNKVYKTVGSDMLVAEHLQESFKKVVTDDVRQDAQQVHLPTLLIYGTDDTATPVTFGKQLQQAIDGSRLELIQDAGHFLLTDSPDKVNALVTEFLK